MNNNVIYYFSGTGNSLNAAIEIAKKLKNTKIISMRCNPELVSCAGAQNIGFIFPVYHWTMPAYVKSFIEKLVINQDAYIFAIASCGGIAVNALNDFNKLITDKGAKVSYSKVHTNVASYVAAYEPFPKPEKQLPKATADLVVIAEEIEHKVSNKAVKNSVLKECMRKFQKPFMKQLSTKDKGFCISKDCISCGLCEKACPTSNIVIRNGRPTFKHHCAQCMSCIVYCPKQAINYKNKTQTRTKYHHPNIDVNLMLEETMEF